VFTRPSNFFVITGCSGGGKSTLLSELEQRGYRVFPEPGRQVVKAQQSVDGDGLPWPELFVQDDERKHSYAEAEQEFYGLQEAYAANGYKVILVPKAPVPERADFLERELLFGLGEDGVE
jgi:predicted ATPase